MSTPDALLRPRLLRARVPEIATTLLLDGAEILVIPSAVPDGFDYLMSLRTRARAQDNQLSRWPAT